MSIQLRSVLYPVTNVGTALIADKETPIIVPFGPAGSGKTMMLYRLFQYLYGQGKVVRGNRLFVPTDLSSVYDKCIDTFFCRLIGNLVAVANPLMPLLFDIIDNRGKRICHILDQTGTSYSDENNIVCLREIVQSPNKKIWMFLLDPFMKNEPILHYVQRIIDVQRTMMSNYDKVVFVATKQESSFKRPIVAFREMQHQYDGLFDAFKNANPITSLFRLYNFDFVAFSAGEFYYNIDGTVEFCAGGDEYPKILWKTILKCI